MIIFLWIDDRRSRLIFIYFSIDRTLTQLGWRRLTDRFSDQYTLMWSEVRSGINYDHFREGQLQLIKNVNNLVFVLTLSELKAVVYIV